MTLSNKRYCSHCGTPNPPTNQTCSKCGKPINSALRELNEETVIVKKRPSSKARIIYEDDDGESFEGDIVTPSSSDVLIQTPPKLTIGGLRAGAQVPSFASEALPPGIEVTSRAYFHQEKFN